MDKEIQVWLFDILNSILEIESFVDFEETNFQDYSSDVKTKRAVERNLEIIGEAVNRISKKDENLEITDKRKIISVRNRIIHGYDQISDELIWSIITQYLPVLEKEVKQYLNE
ncbi:HepT-like ribonuclease domain-containing protein [Cloacibacterium caeni]|uniref:HepT-like ribonuclease domain-containing protein n=1 Tax=Cloacibacterium caeni TaxID=2004710 RepID=UPI001BCE5ADB|nr:HepT-like ribonuclease domain-containing protein [Cloacibacterium caeni]